MWNKLFTPNNKSIWSIFGLCILTLIVMHYYIVFTCPLESPLVLLIIQTISLG